MTGEEILKALDESAHQDSDQCMADREMCREAAALIRQLQRERDAAWGEGYDAGHNAASEY